MKKVQVILIGLSTFLFSCSSNNQQKREDFISVPNTEPIVEQNKDEQDSSKYFFWFGNDIMGGSGSTITLSQEIKVVSGNAKIQAGTSATSDSYVYLYNSDSVKVGFFHANPVNYDDAVVEMIFTDSTQTEINIAYMSLYSWWNNAQLKSMSFYDSSLSNSGVDSIKLQIIEPEVEEVQEFGEFCSYWRGRKLMDEEKKVIFFDEEILANYGHVIIKANGPSNSTILINVFTFDHRKVGEFKGKINNYAKTILDFNMTVNDYMVSAEGISYLEFYSFGSEAQLLEIEFCDDFIEEVGC